MGWTGINEPFPGAADFMRSEGQFKDGVKMVDYDMVGEQLWVVVEIEKDGNTHRMAVLFLIEFGKGTYSYKVMDESVGPCYYDIPARMFQSLTEPLSQGSVAGREKVKKIRGGSVGQK